MITLENADLQQQVIKVKQDHQSLLSLKNQQENQINSQEEQLRTF
jgi:hypothetical protein